MSFDEPVLPPGLAAVMGILKKHQGKSAAIPMSKLAGILYNDRRKTRQLQHRIRKLREMGFAIGLSTKPGENGYYMITDRAEYKATIAQLRAWAHKNLQLASIMENRLDAITAGQMEL